MSTDFVGWVGLSGIFSALDKLTGVFISFLGTNNGKLYAVILVIVLLLLFRPRRE